MKTHPNIKLFTSGVLNSYSQIFFSGKPVFALAIALVTFFDFVAGSCGMFAVIITNLFAWFMGYDRHKISQGYYAFNSLLVGLGLGIYFEPNVSLFLVIVLAAVFTFFITVLLENVIGKYALPYLSIPFLLSFWILTLATRQFTALTISDRGIFKLNALYDLGGGAFIELYNWWNNLPMWESLKIYFVSLGAIFFQFNVLAGIIIAIGILYYSRIAFVLSLLGFYSAYLFYLLIGADITSMSYSHIGFNFILTSIAIGGFFIVPSRLSYLWVILLVPLVAVLTISLGAVFSIYQLSIYSLPFNIVVLLFLYAVKMRLRKREGLTEVILQQNSPEKNLYAFKNSKHRFTEMHLYFPIKLPFWSEWTVYQAHDGKYTHKGDWRFAWDFIINDEHGRMYKDNGTEKEDFYCYNKAVLAPADGYVIEIIDYIPDNSVGDVNTAENWGNVIIIKHAEYLYSKLCHLKQGSFKVYKGEYVRQGQMLAGCGNSGRSPMPHLHFQLQATPWIGSKTLDYPLSCYIKRKGNEFGLESFQRPTLDQLITNIEVSPLLVNAFHFIPGKKISFVEKRGAKTRNVEWEVFTDVYNNSYIYCRQSNSYAYFFNDGNFHYFKNFVGDSGSLLYYFFLAGYKVLLGFYGNLRTDDVYPVHLLFGKPALYLQDFVAPFYIYLESKFSIHCHHIDDYLSPTVITLKSQAVTSVLKKKTRQLDFTIGIGKQGINKITVTEKNKTLCEATSGE